MFLGWVTVAAVANIAQTLTAFISASHQRRSEQSLPARVEELKEEGVLFVASRLRQCKYLNNIVEQWRLFIKRRVNPGLGFFSFKTARRTIGGYEAMNMIRKGQVEGIGKGDIRGQVRFVADLFEVVA